MLVGELKKKGRKKSYVLGGLRIWVGHIQSHPGLRMSHSGLDKLGLNPLGVWP